MAARAASSVKRAESPDALRREAASDPLGLMKRIGCRAILFMKDEQRAITLKWAFRVFCDFREVLRIHGAPVESGSFLPHPRKDIEAALFILLLHSVLAGEKEKTAMFRTSLRSLARFVDIPEEAPDKDGPASKVSRNSGVGEPAEESLEEHCGTAAACERYAASVRSEEERLSKKERALLGIYGL